MFCVAIISIDKEMKGYIYNNGNLLVVWDYLIDKAILNWVNDKYVLNFLIYVFIRSS